MTAMGFGLCFLLGAAVMAAGLLLERLPRRPTEKKGRERGTQAASPAGEGDQVKQRLETELLNFLRYDGTEQEEQ